MMLFSGGTGRRAVRLLCEPVHGHTHWIGGRSLLCPDGHQVCPACRLGYRRRDARWLGVLIDDERSPRLWSLSPKLADVLAIAAGRYDGNPVGHSVIIERNDPHRPWDVVGSKRQPVDKSIEVNDLHVHVARVFGLRADLNWEDTLRMPALVLGIEMAVAYEDRRAAN